MADKPTLREMIAYRPLVIAWVWELACTLGAFAAIAVYDSIPAFFGLVLAGIIPFTVVFLMFMQARKRGEPAARPGSIVE